MRLATYVHHDGCHIGVVDITHQRIYPIASVDPTTPDDMLDCIRAHSVNAPLVVPSGADHLALDQVAIQAPIPRPARNIMCVGKNYLAHANEFARSGFDSSDAKGASPRPEAPIIFTKAPSSVIGPDAPIIYPSGLSEKLDYEAELGVVIGVGGRHIRRADAYRHVFGYTIINDVTARDRQALHRQWFLGKSVDSFCPMGPWLVTADAVDPENLRVRCWVNDELRQDANTRDFIFDIPALIETISAAITLEPGDIIATGTPEGVGIGFDPPRFLRPGDRVRISIAGLGELANTVIGGEV